MQQRRAGAGDGELGYVNMTQHPALPTGIMPMRKNVTRHADWGMAGAARRRLGELRAEPRRGGREDAGKALPATLSWAVAGQRRAHAPPGSCATWSPPEIRSPLENVDASSLNRVAGPARAHAAW